MGVNQNRRPRPSVPVHTKRRQTKKLTRPYTVSKQPVVTSALAGMAKWVQLCCKHSTAVCGTTAFGLIAHMRGKPGIISNHARGLATDVVVPLATTKTRQARRPQSVTRIRKQTFAKRRHTRHRTCDRLRAITQLALRSWHMANRQI
jgi:hypothetical protein